MGEQGVPAFTSPHLVGEDADSVGPGTSHTQGHSGKIVHLPVVQLRFLNKSGLDSAGGCSTFSFKLSSEGTGPCFRRMTLNPHPTRKDGAFALMGLEGLEGEQPG